MRGGRGTPVKFALRGWQPQIAGPERRLAEMRVLEGRAFEAAGVFEIKQTSDLLFHSPFLSCKIYSFCLVRVSKRIPTLHEGRSEANFQESGFCFHWTKIGSLCRLCSRTVLQTAPSAVSPISVFHPDVGMRGFTQVRYHI